MVFTHYFQLIFHLHPQFDSEFHIRTNLAPEHKVSNKTNLYPSEEEEQ